MVDRTPDTCANAKGVARLRPVGGILLVTSASHMPRAVACFRAVGLDLEPYPVDFRTEGETTDFWRPSSRFSENMRMADLAVREWIGLLAYRAAGYTKELLPGPGPSPGFRSAVR